MKKTENFDVIIIGAGLSGLLSASLLGQKGLKVCILEKNAAPGGMIQTFNRQGFSLETGMNFFGAYKETQIQNKLFKLFGLEGLKIADVPYFEIIAHNQKYKIATGFDNFYSGMCKYFPKEKAAIISYVETLKEIFEGIDLKTSGANANLIKYYAVSALDFINSLSENEQVREVLKFNGLLFGNDFENIPLYIYAVLTGSFLQSTGMFAGGTKSFIDAIQSVLSENNVCIHTHKEVVEIKTEGKKVRQCICADNSVYVADYFLSTLHPQNLFPKIESGLLKTFFRKRIAGLSNTKSAFIINVILKKEKVLFNPYPCFINSGDNSILFYHSVSAQMGQFSNVLKIMCYDDFYDYETWFDSKTGKRGREYKQYINDKAMQLFNEIDKYLPNFSDFVERFFISSPLTFRDYTDTPEGCAYGLQKNYEDFEQSLIPANTKFDNLFLSGQSINFHGLLGVSITAFRASAMIFDKCEKKN